MTFMDRVHGGDGWEFVEFFVAGTPIPQPRPKTFRRGKTVSTVSNHGKVVEWKSLVQACAQEAMTYLSMAPNEFELTLRFLMPRPKSHYRKSGELRDDAPKRHTKRPDFDNLCKSTCDALEGIVFYADEHCVDGRISKEYVAGIDDQPGCYILVRRLD